MGMLCLRRRISLQVYGRGSLLHSVLATFIVFPAVYNGYELPQCSNEWITVDETAPTNFICTGILNDNVTWVFRDTVTSVNVTLGYCEPPDTCRTYFASVSQINRVFNRTDLSIYEYRRTTFGGKTLICASNGDEAQCALNFIHIAVIGRCTVDVTVDWKVIGSCEIDKVFSSRDDYRCLWYTSQVNQTVSSALLETHVFNKLSFMESGLRYYRGHCNFTQTFPAENGVYMYFFVFHPGPSGERNQTLKIEPPGGPPTHKCPVYVVEGSTLLCDCTTTRPGDPTAVLSWGADSNSYQLRLENVQRAQNGTDYSCSQTWGRGVQTQKYTLQVAYGPEDKDLSISGSSPFTTDGTRTLNLSCQASYTNPTPQYTWTGVNCNEGERSSTCSFNPRVPEDDEKVVTCTATNTVMTTNTKTAKATYKVTLNYPPSKIVVTGYNSRNLLITGDSVFLTCTVSGAKPPVTGINFYCKRKDNTRINGTFNPASSFSTVTIDVLTVRDNRTGCACDTKGYWPADLKHSLEASIRLTVQVPVAAFTVGVTAPAAACNMGFQLVCEGAGPAVGENDSSNPFLIAAVAGAVGGVGLLLLIVIVVVVVRVTRRRKDTGKIKSDGLMSADCEVLEEHANSMYMSSDADPTSPDQPSRAFKPSPTSLGLSPDSHSKNRVAPANRRSVDLSSGYTYVDVDGEPQKGAARYGGNRFGTANTRMTDFASNNADEDGYSCVEITPPNPMNHISASVHRDSSDYTDADGYSSVLECKPDAGVKKLEGRVDEYDVANRTQSWKATQGRSDVYDHITKKATDVSHEVFAEVNKSSKRHAEGTGCSENGNGTRFVRACTATEAQDEPKKPNSAVKPNPHQTYGAPNHTADSDNYEDVGILQMQVSQEVRQDVTQDAEQDDEYNVLSHKPVSRDQDPQYSHIGDL